jgi:hypothetical protein
MLGSAEEIGEFFLSLFCENEESRLANKKVIEVGKSSVTWLQRGDSQDFYGGALSLKRS